MGELTFSFHNCRNIFDWLNVKGLMINLEQINSLMGKLEFSQNFWAILISLAFPPPLISCERDAVKSFKCKCHFSTGKQMEKLDLESKLIKVFPIHIHNGEKWLEHCWQWIEGDLVFLSHWRWNVWGKSDFWASIQEKWFEAAPENWRELKFFSFYQTGFPPTPNHWFYLGRGKAKFRMWAKLTKTIPV